MEQQKEDDVSSSNRTEDDVSSSNRTEDDVSSSNRTEDDVSSSNRREDDVSSSNRTEDDVSSSNRTEDDVSSSNRTEDDKSSSNRTEEDGPTETNGDRSVADRNAEAVPPVAMETDQSQEPTVTLQKPRSGPHIVEGSTKNPASEKLERVRKWSVSKYKCTRQALAEKLGRGSRTVDLELEPRLELLRDDRQRYDHMTKLAQTLSSQLAQFAVTQKSLGDVFTELSVKSQKLHVEFKLNAEAQKFLSKNGETLTAAISSFTSDMNTLVNKTMEDTMINAKQYEAARIEYDAYRVDLEELNMGPRDATTVPKLEQAQRVFQGQRERYEKVRDDLSVKVKLLEENRVKVLQQQLFLLHGAVAAHCFSCHTFLQQNLQQAAAKLESCSVDDPSWLEES